ncbi:MAG: hypothetical protein RL556_796 [Actinomycetota bacterium]|jgi:predicted MFS family arabinose efflux permease
MTKATAKLSAAQAKTVERSLPVMFFTQGFIALALVPRVPELMKQLNATPATWGLVVGLSGAVGILAMIFGSRIVKRFSTRPVMLATSTVFSLAVGAYGFLHSAIAYFVVASIFSIAMGLYNLALNTNAVTFQKLVKRVILGKFHASWSIGATATTAFGGILANFLPLNFHLIIMSAISLAAFWFFGRKVLPSELDGHAERKHAGVRVPFFKSPSLLWWLAAGNITGVMCEAMLIDWSSVFTQKTMGLPLTISAIPYTVFGLAMITGRLSISRLAKRFHFSDLARFGGMFGSIALGLGIFVGPAVATHNQVFGMLVTAFFWMLAGFGVAPMMPSFASASGSVPKIDTTQAMARMTLITYFIMTGAKIFMGGLVGSFGLQMAFIFVVVCFFTASQIAGKVAKTLKASDVTPNAFPETGVVSVVD